MTRVWPAGSERLREIASDATGSEQAERSWIKKKTKQNPALSFTRQQILTGILGRQKGPPTVNSTVSAEKPPAGPPRLRGEGGAGIELGPSVNPLTSQRRGVPVLKWT